MSTITIKKVALAGASGNLGPAILQALLDANFEVTVITRQDSKSKFPDTVKVAPVDYNSLSSLVEAFTGQDAVVSTLGTAAVATQLLLVKAAAQAKVKRFIPSEFGSNTVNEKAAKLPVFKDKIAVQHALREEVSTGGQMTYTLIVNGPFLDWGLMVGFIISLKKKFVNLYDGGEQVFSTTTLPSIGKAVAGVLKHYDQTVNRVVYVESTAISLKELTEKGKKVVGSDGWTENQLSVDQVLKEAYEELAKENPDPNVWVMKSLAPAVWGKGYGAEFEKLDNELLGVEKLTNSEFDALLEKYSK